MQSSTSAGLVLMGPSGVGKSTIGSQVAQQIGLPFHDLSVDADQYRGPDYPNQKTLSEIYASEGYGAVIRHLMPHRAAVLQRALQDYGSGVIEVGALYSIYESDELLDQVKEAFASYDEAVLLLPSPDVEQSIQILEARTRIVYRGQEWFEFLARHPSHSRLANHTVYTQGKSPGETALEIVNRLEEPLQPIFLLGPVGAGKTTIGRLLSERLGVHQVSLDGIRRTYYAEVGYSREDEAEIAASGGFGGVLDYWKQFDAHALKRVLEDHATSIIDFGGGQTAIDNQDDLRRIEQLLSPFPNVFLLMPSEDIEESIKVLRRRMVERTSIDGKRLELFLLTHPSNEELSTNTIHTEEMSLEHAVQALTGLIELNRES